MLEPRVRGTRQATEIAARRLLSALANVARRLRRPAGNGVATAVDLHRVANLEILAHITDQVVELTTEQQGQRLAALFRLQRPQLSIKVC